jgi:uncharacterized membrane protein
MGSPQPFLRWIALYAVAAAAAPAAAAEPSAWHAARETLYDLAAGGSGPTASEPP